jgi:dTDP-4-dehydrorhamnose 3,5-epimerase
VEIKPLRLHGSCEITLQRIEDERGYFLRVYDGNVPAELGIETSAWNDSISFNKKRHTVRGLHFQLPPFEEKKIVRVSRGAIWDVIVDLRQGSETYGQWEGYELSEENNKCLYIPHGFAHGFCTLTDDATVNYKIDAPYHPGSASGIRWNDATLDIPWQTDDPVISERDTRLGSFADFVSPF